MGKYCKAIGRFVTIFTKSNMYYISTNELNTVWSAKVVVVGEEEVDFIKRLPGQIISGKIIL